MKFLNEHTCIMHGLKPIDKNDRTNEKTAVRLSLPDNFSEKAKACWKYFMGAAFIFEYKEHLVITDEGLYLTEHGDGTHGNPIGFPRWVCDSWEEFEKILEETYDDLVEDGMIEEAWRRAMYV
ncbi:MAG: hypothetical protein NC177_05765 [Ruminococcus flavefaciens]|nr:hypothetical protein [Ruminococcus flavefaciens]